MAIKISGTTVINDDRDLTNIVDMTVTGDVSFTSTGAIQLPSGNTAAQPSASGGKIRYNTEIGRLEYYDGITSRWRTLSAAGTSGALSADNFFVASTSTL